MTTDAPAGPPPGFYPDPNDASRRRRWDGSTWTDEYEAQPPSPAPPTASEGVTAIVPLGYLAALFLPVVGIILGIVGLYSPNPKNRPHAVAIIMISILVAAIAVAYFAGVFDGPSAEVDCETFPEYC